MQQKCSLILWCRLREVVAKSRVQMYFEQPILALFLVFHQTYNWSHNKFSHVARQVEGFCISYFWPPLLSCGLLANRLLQLSFVLALLWLNSVWSGFSVSLFRLLYVRWRPLDLARWPNLADWPSFAQWPSTLLARWPIVELASLINIPRWHLTKVGTKVHSRRIGNKNN